ncbi:MAG TPA: DUF177 domain-containing protein [Bacilli bacterium]
MFVNIQELAATGKTVHISEQIALREFVERHADIVSADNLKVDLSATYVSGAVHVTGNLQTELTLSCSRCLNHFTEQINSSFAEVFVYDPDKAAEDPETDVEYVRAAKVDLRPYLLENVSLEIPFIPLCSDSCKGLCPICGANRNEHECACKEEHTDPRLAGLQEFFNRKSSE